jgi:hypothetical protein
MQTIKSFARELNKREFDQRESYVLNYPDLDRGTAMDLSRLSFHKYLDSQDTKENKDILEDYIAKNPRGHRFNIGKIITKDNIYGELLNLPSVFEDLVERGYDFTPKSISQRHYLEDDWDAIKVLAKKGQISPEFVCWLIASENTDMDDPITLEALRYIVRGCTRFPEYQPRYLKALCDMLHGIGVTGTALYIEVYIEKTESAMFHVWDINTKSYLCDHNIFKHIILKMLP